MNEDDVRTTYADQVFDYLLEELITAQRPPDLTARIEAAWKREQAAKQRSGTLPLVKAEVVENPQPSINGRALGTSIVGAEPTLPSPPVRPIQIAAKPERRQLYRRSKRGHPAAWLLAASACLLLFAMGWYLRNGAQEESQAVALEPSEQAAATDGLADKRPSGNSNAEDIPSERPAVEVLNIDDLPFASNSQPQPPSTERIEQPVAIQRLPGPQIVAQLDRQLTQVWNALGVSPTPKLPPEQVAQKISNLLTGQELSREQLEKQIPAEQVVREGTQSAAFARTWSERFAELWLQRASLPMEDARIQELEQSIFELIAAGRPWNDVALDLLGGPIDSQSGSSTTTFVYALAGNGNHRLAERIGLSFLDTNLACIRCHDAPAGGRPVSIDQQEMYWSIIALLNGVNAFGNTARNQRVVIDKQAELFARQNPPTVYFGLLNGLLKAAEAKLPSGDGWDSIGSARVPREALATWISQSPQMDAAAVNQVWKLVFGRLLVPQVSGIEDVSLEQRIALQRFLADQFRAHDRDLRKLVGWVVQSDALTRQPLQLNRNQWLNASEEVLAQLQIADAVFACGSSLSPASESGSLEKSLLAVLDWSGDSRGLDASTGDSLLGQPVPVAPRKKGAQDAKIPPHQKMPPVDYVIHGERHSTADEAFVSRLLQSGRLSWEQCVEHVVGLNPNYVASGRVKQLANELLQHNGGDAQAALLNLLWAVRNSDTA